MSIFSRSVELACAVFAVASGLAVSSFSGYPARPDSPVREAISNTVATETPGRGAVAELEISSSLSAEPLPPAQGPRQTELFPDVQLVDQAGNQHLFRSDFAIGKVLCLAMFYTRCDGSCPGTISKVLKLRRSLTEEFGRENLHFVCLTLDPLHDQPEVLHRYAAALGVENDRNLAPIFFCTGTPENLNSLRRSLGMYDPDPAIDADIRQHAAKILFGNDMLNRWSGMPAGLPFEDLYETALRIAGTSERQKFSTRLAIDGRK
ncbi:MAG: SCO family protein [Planctomycetaceae bacterium]